MVNALLVYLFVILTFRTPFFILWGHGNKEEKEKVPLKSVIPLFSALLFATHPIQTQAVTYIVQRFISLATLFYLLPIVTYIKGRLLSQSAESGAQGVKVKEKKPVPHALGPALFYLLSLVFAIAAMKTKEIAFTLPMVVVLYEFYFFKIPWKKKLLFLLPIMLTLIIIPLSLIGTNKSMGEILSDLSERTRLITDIPRWDYLVTQMRVITTYIRLIFLPVNQNLDYDYPIYHSLFTPSVFLSFLLLLSIFGFGVYLLYASRIRAMGGVRGAEDKSRSPVATNLFPYYRLVGFGILWFFVALSVESSVIPIVDVIFEHRVYLPSAGAFMAIAVSIYIISEKMRIRWEWAGRAVMVTGVVVIIVLLGAVYERNMVWQDKVRLWEDVVRKSPQKARGHYNLGANYAAQGMTDKAVAHYQIALRINPNFKEAHNNLGNAYESQGLVDKAIEQYRIAISLDTEYVEAYNNLGVAYKSQGLIEKAMKQLHIAINIKPDYPDAHNNLGLIYESQGLIEKAIEQSQIAISLKPHNPEAHINLAVAYIKQGRYDDALNEAREGIRLDVNNADAYNNLRTAYRKLGRHGEAIEAAEQALKVNPGYAVPYNNLGLAYVETRQFSKAIDAFNKAVNLDHDYTEAYSNLGALYITLGKYPDAIEAFNKAVEITPDYINSRFNLGVAYSLIGERESAMKEYGVLKELSPEFAERLWSFINRN
jgi:tetratricopeptide (TPR) repeat protein